MDSEIMRILLSTCNDDVRIVFEYFIPLFQITALVINILNACIFACSKNPVHRYLLVNSIVDTTMFLLQIFQTRHFCNRKPDVFLTYWFQIYHLYVCFYLLKIISMTGSMINIQIAVERYSLMLNGYDKKPLKKRLLLCFIIFSSLFYLPNIVFNKIYTINNDNKTHFIALGNTTKHIYIVFFTKLAQERVEIRYLISFLQSFTSLIFFLIVFVINVQIYKNFKSSRRIAENVSIFMKNTKIENIRMTVMVLWISLIFMFDQVLAALNSVEFVLVIRTHFYFKFIAYILFFRSILSLTNPIFYFIYYYDYRKIIKNFCLMFFFILIFILFSIFLFFSLA
jgi:hypothetical protein